MLCTAVGTWICKCLKWGQCCTSKFAVAFAKPFKYLCRCVILSIVTFFLPVFDWQLTDKYNIYLGVMYGAPITEAVNEMWLKNLHLIGVLKQGAWDFWLPAWLCSFDFFIISFPLSMHCIFNKGTFACFTGIEQAYFLLIDEAVPFARNAELFQ